ncbi:hypothetical protein EL17_06025 [Anditalea andensis]|uniref:Uncharacterized protein n=2 Tax=Anditalea andensis TaxID=1048983 RepID=A0A074KZ19_9BACT|nr:hypothetical protein EL17_06025 [Anditalea andensis]
MKQKIKLYLYSQLNQFIPVVLGVYIGIVASNWNENRVRKQEQEEFITNLILEIETNKEKLVEIKAYQEAILTSARKAGSELDDQLLEAPFWKVGHWKLINGWEGLKIPTLENAVQQSGIMTNALSGLDFTTIHLIARSYNHQEEYKIYAQKLIFDNLTQIDNATKTIEVINKLEVWQDMINLANAQIQEYDKTLENLSLL